MKYRTKRGLVLALSVLLLVFLYLFKNYSSFVRVAGVIFGSWLFYFFDHAFGLDFKLRHYFYMFAILFFGIFLTPLYFVSSSYDKVLHLLMPILGCIMIFYFVDRQKVSFKWKLLITLMIIISFLALHEVGEYIIDYFWDFKLQGVYLRDVTGLEKFNLVLPKNDDTMIDMMFGIAGGVIFVIGKSVCYFYNNRLKGLVGKRKKR